MEGILTGDLGETHKHTQGLHKDPEVSDTWWVSHRDTHIHTYIHTLIYTPLLWSSATVHCGARQAEWHAACLQHLLTGQTRDEGQELTGTRQHQHAHSGWMYIKLTDVSGVVPCNFHTQHKPAHHSAYGTDKVCKQHGFCGRKLFPDEAQRAARSLLKQHRPLGLELISINTLLQTGDDLRHAASTHYVAPASGMQRLFSTTFCNDILIFLHKDLYCNLARQLDP